MSFMNDPLFPRPFLFVHFMCGTHKKCPSKTVRIWNEKIVLHLQYCRPNCLQMSWQHKTNYTIFSIAKLLLNRVGYTPSLGGKVCFGTPYIGRAPFEIEKFWEPFCYILTVFRGSTVFIKVLTISNGFNGFQ